MKKEYRALETAELLHELEQAGRAPDLELIRVCMDRRAGLTPGLLDMLGAPPEDWAQDDPRWYAAIHAGNLLIHYREPQAIPIFMRLLRDSENQNLIEWFASALAAYGLAILAPARDLLDDRRAPEYSRTSITETLEEVAAEFPTERGQVAEILRASLPGLAANGNLLIPSPHPRKPNSVWTLIATTLARLHDQQSRPQIEALYRDGWMDLWVMGDQKQYLELLTSSEPLHAQPFNIIETYEQMRETVRQKAEWEAKHAEIVAQQEKLKQQAEQARAASVSAPSPPLAAPSKSQTIRRAEPKVGRNEPCPCGSGRKYKHCHGK